MTTIRSARLAGALALLLLAAPGCQDLDVTNPNLPDRERALAEPGDVEALAAGTFLVHFNRLHNRTTVYNPMPLVGEEMTATYANDAALELSSEPRISFNNNPLSDAHAVSRFMWQDWHSIVSSTNEVLQTIEGGMVIRTPVDGPGTAVQDNTARARAFAKFMQGVAFGYLATMYDKAVLIDETVPIPADPEALRTLVIERQRPYPEIRAQAIRSLREAISISEANSFTLPGTWIPGQSVTSAELARIARTYIARVIVYSARTPAERAAADWQAVLDATAQGITRDFGPLLNPSTLTSALYTRVQSSGAFVARADYKLVGPADVSGNYQRWLSTPVEQRTRFLITTPDRRITGPTPTSNGSYFRYRSDDTGFRTDRGTYHFSAYQWFRRGGNTNSGLAVIMSVDENRLLRAEALLRRGSDQEAANLVNVSRTRPQVVGGVTYPGLPAVTAGGVPNGPTCVPRRDDGSCGSLLDALVYERMIEAAALDGIRAYQDSRGFGRLPRGTFLQMPIPGRELETLRQPLYTFGGVGGDWAAP